MFSLLLRDVVDYSTGEARMRIQKPLNEHCSGMLRQRGKSAEVATTYLARLSIAEKNEHLFRHGINFNELPDWQKRGIGILWETYAKAGTNLLTGETVIATRRRVQLEFNFPMKGDYSAWIRELIDRELVGSASAGVFDPLVETQ